MGTQEEYAQIKDSVKKQLEPLFADFYVGSPLYKKWIQHTDKIRDKLNKSSDMMKSLSELLNLFGVKGKQKSQSQKIKQELEAAYSWLVAIVYLTDVEVIGDFFVNLTILLLTAKGIDFHLEPDYEHRYTRHAHLLEEIESPSIPLSTKLDFLTLNGLPFFSEWIDRTLRNDIAHMSFEISDKGDFIALRRGKRKKINLTEKFVTFTLYQMAATKVFNDCLSKTNLNAIISTRAKHNQQKTQEHPYRNNNKNHAEKEQS